MGDVNPGTIALVALAIGSVLSGGVYLLVQWWTNFHVSWVPLVGSAVVGAVYFSPVPGFDPAKLAAALTEVRSDLLAHTKWSQAQLDKGCLGQAHIFVKDTPTWVNNGVKVAGLQLGHTIYVGSDYAALLHESAHLCQELVDGFVDFDHKGWAGNGIYEADAAYGAWLRE